MNGEEQFAPNDDLRIAALAQQLLHGAFRDLSPREQRVIATIARRQSATRNVNFALDEQLTLGQRLADKVARFGGSWAFIVIFVSVLAVWIVSNSLMGSRLGYAFDAYPFVFLNLVLSMVAALQAPVILMSQNEQANRDRTAAGLDYEVNLKSELEIMTLHDKLDGLRIDSLERTLKEQGAQLSRILDKLNPRPLA